MHSIPLSLASVGLFLTLSHIVIAKESNVSLPVHGRRPMPPENVAITASIGGVARVTNLVYRDLDNDAFDRWNYQWSPTQSENNIVANTSTYNLKVNEEVYVRVAAVAKTGFPVATTMSQWSQWSPAYKWIGDIFTAGDCNSNDFIYSQDFKVDSNIYMEELTVGGVHIGQFNNPYLSVRTIIEKVDKPIKSFNIWTAINPNYSSTTRMVEYTEIIYMDDTVVKLADSHAVTTEELNSKQNQFRVNTGFAPNGRYAKGAIIEGVAACRTNFSNDGITRWQGYTGIRFALRPAT